MLKYQVSPLDPDLVIGRTAAIDFMGDLASHAAECHKPNYRQQIYLVRKKAHNLCSAYINCKNEDWCFMCASGQNDRPLFLGESCLKCKLLVITSPEIARASKLVQISFNQI